MAGLGELTSAEAVRQAMHEYDQIGRGPFLKKYGFRPARAYFVSNDGKLYDSKAIAGVAYGIQHPERGHLTWQDFVGGDATVRPKLESLGFTVVSDGPPQTASFASDQLVVGEIYPREDLIEIFSITDATINTGVFRPSGYRSIWLFVTRDKTNDRTQYRDHLEGDLLHWEGQTSGRTDSKIIDHQANGDELLVFYRESKRQHPKAGFKLEGRFKYLSHSPGKPSRFLLQRIDNVVEGVEEFEADPFDPASVEDGRKKVLASVARRQGQGAFRRALMRAYDGQCAVTGCAIEALLEAAHIHPYLGPETNHTTNGLLLRADIHTLFDLGLMAINHSNQVVVSDRLLGSDYDHLSGKSLQTPTDAADHPSSKALAWHRTQHHFGSD
ncbi:HNH endonuclease [Qipengyuania sp. 6B39]|uniref:HNH endonuclease n=1 Tax=Qipengyuania proteolytica TaxID=2867239 RepID=UPI001C89FCB1|nr:HNH endonuclease [Qipengyuania proteolytica]MBX7497226.1 HNH endonuclease [Qipengyuania proteolytica]